MTEKQTNYEDQPEKEETDKQTAEKETKKNDPVSRITKKILIIILVIFVWYIFADRYAPYTDQARTRTYVIPLVPRVSGYLTEISVGMQSVVKANDLLLQIDKRPYKLAVDRAKAHLDNVAQQVGALTATVKSAAGRLGVAKAQLDRAQRNYNRTQKVLEKNPGALSQADLDQTETALAQAVERVASAEADLEKSKQKLGTSGNENAQLREAIVSLEQAEYDLENTSIYAPADGVIESFNLDIGYYASAGKPLLTFLPKDVVWLEAYYRENSITNIKGGDEVEFSLDVLPGHVFKGTVRSVAYGVSYGESTDRGKLPKISNPQSWLRDPQRFPVLIEIGDREALKFIRTGGQADVVVYTSGNFILNTIAWLQIRVSSWLSYVR